MSGPALAADSPSAAPGRMLVDAATRETFRLAVLMGAVSVLLPLGVLLYAQITGKDYWTLFWGERNAITWFSTVQLLLIGLVAYVNHEASALMRRLEIAGSARHQWIWLIFALGFVFLALDERFEIHETLREDVMQPAEMFVGIPYLKPGDIGLFLYFVVGVGFAWFLFAELRRQPLSLVFFGAALLLALSFMIVDSLPKPVTRSWPLGRFWTSVYEEVAELWAQFLFLLSFLTVLRGRLKQLTRELGQ